MTFNSQNLALFSEKLLFPRIYGESIVYEIDIKEFHLGEQNGELLFPVQ